MWYWKTSERTSIRYFETAQAACDDAPKHPIYNVDKAIQIINIPDEKNPNYVKVSARLSRNRLVPDFVLFPQERIGTPILPSLTEEFNRIINEAEDNSRRTISTTFKKRRSTDHINCRGIQYE